MGGLSALLSSSTSQTSRFRASARAYKNGALHRRKFDTSLILEEGLLNSYKNKTWMSKASN